jgi:hypothetical protein
MTSKRRTIVGSHPHRRTLPMGREAIERAVAHIDTWGTDVASSGSREASRCRGSARLRPDLPNGFAVWLPVPSKHVKRDLLVEMLAAEVRP